MEKDLKRLSKFLAVLLRHRPDKFNIELDDQGFADIDHVWVKVEHKFGDTFTRDHLDTIVTVGDKHGKKRYEIVNGRIRAMYGHSQPIITYPSIIPPEILFHGTNYKALKSIQEQGLVAGTRQYVHMTTNLNTATIVAERRTQNPIILKVHSFIAYENGIVFHNPEDELYLAKTIPAEYIEFLDN